MPNEEIVKSVITYLEKSLLEDIKQDINKSIKQMVQEEFVEVNRRFARLEKTMDMWKSDLDIDRASLRDIRTDTGNINTELKEVGKMVDTLPQKLENTVKDTLPGIANDAIPKAVNDTFEVFGKKVKVVQRPFSLIKLIKFWK